MRNQGVGADIDAVKDGKTFSLSLFLLERFMTVEGTSKNRIISPNKVLHFYNSPPDSNAESLKEVFGKVSVQPPMGIKFFSQGSSLVVLPGGGGWGVVFTGKLLL